MNISMTYPQLLRNECTIDGSVIKMTPIMCRVLERLLLKRNTLVRWDEVIEAAYPNPDEEPESARDSIKVTISRHRALRIGIETRWGSGLFIPVYNDEAPK